MQMLSFDELKQYLDSPANEYGLDSVATHGFLMASVVGKPLVDWQAVYFDGEQAKVKDTVKQALRAWQLALLEDLQNERGLELPFLVDVSTNGEYDRDELDFSPESDLSAWSVGFIDAMYGDLNDGQACDTNWFVDEELAEDVAMLTLPMMVFSGVDVVSDENGHITEQDAEFAKLRQDEASMVQMVNSIEDNLTELYLLFHTEE